VQRIPEKTFMVYFHNVRELHLREIDGDTTCEVSSVLWRFFFPSHRLSTAALPLSPRPNFLLQYIAWPKQGSQEWQASLVLIGLDGIAFPPLLLPKDSMEVPRSSFRVLWACDVHLCACSCACVLVCFKQTVLARVCACLSVGTRECMRRRQDAHSLQGLLEVFHTELTLKTIFNEPPARHYLIGRPSSASSVVRSFGRVQERLCVRGCACNSHGNGLIDM
jgi:hypothetical protein